MANQQLVDYIKSQLAAGVTKPDLEKAIATAGWSQADTADAFNVVEGKTPATPVVPAAPKPAAPEQPVVQPVQQPKPVQPIQPVAAAQPIVNPTGPTSTIAPNLGGPMRASTMQMNVQATTPRRHTVLWATLATVVVLVVGSAAAYMYVPAVKEVVNFYLSGGQVQTPIDTTPTTTDTTMPPIMPPAATTTPTATTTSTTTGTVASTTASTTLGN